MKFVLTTICLFLISLYSCDIINENDYLIDYTPPIPEGKDTRFILLEDYTGMRCSNCPKAAAMALNLKEIYGERLITVAVHAGYFARPFTGVDLRTEAGTAYDDYFEISGNPQGVINRTPYKDKIFNSFTKWGEAITAVPQKTFIGMDLKIDYTPENRSYSVSLDITKFQLGTTESPDLILWLVEDNIVTPQTMENGKWIYDYNQRHVLRSALNGTWGENITLPSNLGSTIKIEKKSFILPEAFKEKDCSVIALLCDKNSKEVIQVTEASLIAFYPDKID